MLKSQQQRQQQIFAQKYYIISTIGSGSFGKIYKAINYENKTHYAVKTEKKGIKSNLLQEVKILLMLQEEKGFTKIYQYGHQQEQNFLVMDLLGHNLETMRARCKGKFSYATIKCLAPMMIDRIKSLHTKNFVHRDLKPQNFMMSKNMKDVYLIDFGLSEEIGVGNKQIVGNARFCSKAAHQGLPIQKKDDLESIGYILVYLIKGCLPWQDEVDIPPQRQRVEIKKIAQKEFLNKNKTYLNNQELKQQYNQLNQKQNAEFLEKQYENDNDKFKSIHNHKIFTKIDLLVEGLPICFKQYFQYLQSSDIIDYDYLKNLFMDPNAQLEWIMESEEQSLQTLKKKIGFSSSNRNSLQKFKIEFRNNFFNQFIENNDESICEATEILENEKLIVSLNKSFKFILQKI